MQTMAGLYKYRSARRLKWALFILNVIGAIVYVRAASVAWAIPEERAQGIYSVTGEPLIWALSVLPVFASFCLIDLVGGGVHPHQKSAARRLPLAIELRDLANCNRG
jgi:hypothetical protein